MTPDDALGLAETWEAAMIELDAQMDSLTSLVGAAPRSGVGLDELLAVNAADYNGEYDMSQAMREMPRYECHKQVWALKIKDVVDNKATQPELAFEEDGYAPLSVDWDWYYKHKPQPGGYYVVYADGYKSYSPAKAFEDGYTRI